MYKPQMQKWLSTWKDKDSENVKFFQWLGLVSHLEFWAFRIFIFYVGISPRHIIYFFLFWESSLIHLLLCVIDTL